MNDLVPKVVIDPFIDVGFDSWDNIENNYYYRQDGLAVVFTEKAKKRIKSVDVDKIYFLKRKCNGKVYIEANDYSYAKSSFSINSMKLLKKRIFPKHYRSIEGVGYFPSSLTIEQFKQIKW